MWASDFLAAHALGISILVGIITLLYISFELAVRRKRTGLMATSGPELVFIKPIRLWNAIGTIYYALLGKHITSLKYEDLFVSRADLNKEVQELARGWEGVEPIKLSDDDVENLWHGYELQYRAYTNTPDTCFSPFGLYNINTVLVRLLELRRELFAFVREENEAKVLAMKGSSRISIPPSAHLPSGKKPSLRELVLKRGGVDGGAGLIVIAGLHRTGSTLLMNLLLQDKNAKGIYMWDMMTTPQEV